jgi:hypothetical protein
MSPSMDHPTEVANLKAALQAAADGSNAEGRKGVESAVRELVDVLKSAGWPIEAIIVQLKKTAAESGLATARANIVADGLQTPTERLVESAVRVSIEHYYR